VSSLRVVTVAGSSIEQIRAFEEKFRVKVTHGYGITESVAASCSNPIEGKCKNESIGFPYIGMEMEIFDEQDRPLPPGQIGEIVQRGPLVMKGYFNNPGATAEALRGGWLHTGDLGYKDEEGYFYLVDRKKEMIRRGGLNVYPREVERVLYTHPQVKEAAVIGIPDLKYGEEIKAVIQPKEGAWLDEEEIQKFCQENLADYKCPRKIQFLQEMPLTGSGKIDKKELRRREREGGNG
jgi:long-chain acyl-CoA synthetase